MRPINMIAYDIIDAWNKPHYAAIPYLNALMSLKDKTSRYGYDSAEGIILRFLGNASTFRGQRAKELKTELKQHIK